LAVKYQSAHRWQRAIKFNPHHLVLWSFLGLSQWVYVRDDMSKGLKIMSLGVINHGMSQLRDYRYLFYLLTFNIVSRNYCYWRMYFWQLIWYPLAVNIWLFVDFHCQRMSVLLSFSFVLESSTWWPRVLY
jgi:hypothetical protein